MIGHKIFQAEDAVGALEYLAKLPMVDSDRIGVIGFSAGAIAINSVLANQMKIEPGKLSFHAAIAMYGLCRNLFNYGEDSIPLMDIVAQNDSYHARSCIDAGKNYPNLEVHVLSGAYHAFDKIDGSGKRDSVGSFMLYSKTATDRARELTKKFCNAPSKLKLAIGCTRSSKRISKEQSIGSQRKTRSSSYVPMSSPLLFTENVTFF